MPTIQISHKDRRNPASISLLNHAANETSQFGEDGIIAAALTAIGSRNRWCVEAGAWDGVHFSNTHSLMKQGWSGVFIEANAEKFSALQKTYCDCPNAHLMNSFVGLDGANMLDQLLADTQAPADLDLLSLDIDGPDYWVWESFTEYRPRLVVIEFNPSVPNDVLFVQDRDPRINQGCSLLALMTLAKRKGYELIAVTDCNAIFVTADDFLSFHILDNSIDAMYDPSHSGRIFQGFDGTIFTAGMPRLIWHNREIDPEDLQVLPPNDRRFPDSISN
jgi:hypothetical protein